MAKDKLNRKQERFVDEFMEDFNATKAAIRAGYSAKSARVQGHRMITNANIAAEIQHRKEEIAERIRNQFVNDAERARDVLFEILNDSEASDRDRITAAKDFLDRAGYKATDKQQIEMGGSMELQHEAGASIDDRIEQYAEVYKKLYRNE